MAKKNKKTKEVEVEKDYGDSTNYNVYHMSILEKVIYTLLAAGVLFGLGYVFYHNVIISSIFALLAMKYPKMKTKDIIRKRKRQLSMQFKDMLYSLSSAISSGSSIELALAIVKDDMINQYGDGDVFIVKELEAMVSKVSLNMNIEDIFSDFAERSGLEDVKTFADIFIVSKRTGGNLVQIIRQTTDIIADKIEIETQMQTMISGKKMESKIVTIMPIALTVFMTVSTDGFMDPVFTTCSGRAMATVALALILVATLWSNAITNIEV